MTAPTTTSRGKNLKGRFLELLRRTGGKGALEKAFVNGVKAVEARNYKTRATESRTPGMAIAS